MKVLFKTIFHLVSTFLLVISLHGVYVTIESGFDFSKTGDFEITQNMGNAIFATFLCVSIGISIFYIVLFCRFIYKIRKK